MKNKLILGICCVLVLSMVGIVSGCASGTYTAGCPEGTRWSNRYQRCEALIPSCPAGYEWYYNQCKSICRDGKRWDARTNSCECPSHSVWIEDVGSCVERSQLKAVREKIAQQRTDRRAYEAHEASKCPEGTKYVRVPQNSLLGPCFPVCDYGAHWDTMTKRCVNDCPSGTAWDIFAKQCISICKGGWWDKSQSTCICPAGQEWDDFFKRCTSSEE